MIKCFSIAILAFALLSGLTGAKAQVLWNKTNFGMTANDVKGVVPYAVPCSEAGNRLANGAVALLCKPNVLINHELFKAQFYFNGRGLIQVTLSLEGKHDFHNVRLIFDGIADALRSKYGRELSLKYQSGLLNEAIGEWVSGRTNINLLGFSVANAPATLNVNYQVRLAEDADKL
jgi:hypothetical protein